MVSLLSNDFWQHDLEPLVFLFVCLFEQPRHDVGLRGWRGGDSALVGASNIVRLSKNVSAECVPTDGRQRGRFYSCGRATLRDQTPIALSLSRFGGLAGGRARRVGPREGRAAAGGGTGHSFVEDRCR